MPLQLNVKHWDLSICGLDEVPDVVDYQEHKDTPLTAVISIESSRKTKSAQSGRSLPILPNYLNKRHFILDCPENFDFTSEKGQFRRDIYQVFSFVQQNADKNGGDLRLLIHCQAGIRRSTAVALLLICALQAEKSLESSVESLLRLRFEAIPSLEIIEIGDQMLGLKGHLVEAVQNNPGLRGKLRRKIPEANWTPVLGL